ncbi:MAG: hypothetical protein KDK34_13375 [Leptospiraceae bacterium]|nr:hypothetical protein [Leptospiraceae bacterium]
MRSFAFAAVFRADVLPAVLRVLPDLLREAVSDFSADPDDRERPERAGEPDRDVLFFFSAMPGTELCWNGFRQVITDDCTGGQLAEQNRKPESTKANQSGMGRFGRHRVYLSTRHIRPATHAT